LFSKVSKAIETKKNADFGIHRIGFNYVVNPRWQRVTQKRYFFFLVSYQRMRAMVGKWQIMAGNGRSWLGSFPLNGNAATKGLFSHDFSAIRSR
jgi:hypothetical protein